MNPAEFKKNNEEHVLEIKGLLMFFNSSSSEKIKKQVKTLKGIQVEDRQLMNHKNMSQNDIDKLIQ